MHLGDDSILLRWQRRCIYSMMVNPNGQFFFQDRGLVIVLGFVNFGTEIIKVL